jgi:hypothetical protein
VVLAVGRKTLEVWARYEGQTSAKPLAAGEKVAIPGSQYVFYITEFVPSGQLVENYRPDDGRRAVAALRVEAKGALGKPVTLWLEPGRQRVVSTEHGPLAVSFNYGRASVPGGHE